MYPVVILNRITTHYRLPLYRRLFEEFGWVVACARTPPSGTFLKAEFDEPFLLPFDITFPDPNNHYRANVPLGEILRQTGAKAILAEFSLHMDSTYKLVARRRLCGHPVTLFWSHGYNMERGLSSWTGRLLQVPRVALHLLADGAVCYSEEGKDFLQRYMDAKRVLVVRNSIDVSPMQALSSAVDHPGARGWPSLLTIGRMTSDKEVPRLVHIFRQFRRRFPNTVLTIVGDGPDFPRIRQAVGEDLGDAVMLAGEIYDEDQIARLFRSADLAVFTGAVGLSVNHALAYGVPVMAFERTPRGPHHHPEIAYVVDDVTGFRVPQYTDDAMVDALCDFFARNPNPKHAFHSSITKYVIENLTLDAAMRDFRKVRDFLRSLGVAGA